MPGAPAPIPPLLPAGDPLAARARCLLVASALAASSVSSSEMSLGAAVICCVPVYLAEKMSELSEEKRDLLHCELSVI